MRKLEASKGQDIAAKAKVETNYSCAEQMKQNAPAHAINWQPSSAYPASAVARQNPRELATSAKTMLANRS